MEINTVESYLEAMVKIRARCGNKNNSELVYTCPEAFVLKHGIKYELLLGKCERGQMKECYSNATKLAISDSNLTYVEGFASGIIPVMHAWCINEEGQVLDPTWPDGTEYFGVPFQTDYLCKTIDEREYYGLLDNYQMNYPLLTGKHSIKEAIRA